MKLTRTLLSLAVLAGVLAVGTPMASAQTYLGEFCWNASEFEPSADSGTNPPSATGYYILRLKAGVTHLGGAYYLLQGRMGTTSSPSSQLFLQATGVVVGDVLWLNGTTTEDDGTSSTGETVRHSGIMQLALSFSNSSRGFLWGTFWRIQTDIVSPDGLTASFSQRYITGWVSFIGTCQ